jgi:DNA-binding HxlR family transcriptional regulator
MIDDIDAAAHRASFRRALGTISGRWKLEILWLLNQRTHRFGELRRAIPNVTQRMLTMQLRELEADGLVERTAYAEVPLRVEYEIKPLARELKPVFDAVMTWSVNHPLMNENEAAVVDSADQVV